ncbi:hypothetical protein [Mangrovihabitans endophyticus]|uniref:3-keto-disaccharide hydrolase domain-containing protein n=1 Tax=Mangrovihabitans endophyticus TaxID=1751298 RepID=A0A8J3C4E8_9ACTN|nr:hypothetical protein [Mangrovihabitans endophyticus]GGL17165.1 hypothetical protein GCM10012284_59690 [Mangrovihabitans endophyticus]
MRVKKRVAVPMLASVLTTLITIPAVADTTPPNQSFEQGWENAKLKCWSVGGTGDARFTVTGRGHSGWAAYVEGHGPDGERLKLTSDQTPECAIAVTAGKTYSLSFWSWASDNTEPVVYAFTPGRGWRHWYWGAKIPGGPLARHSMTLPPIRDGVTLVSVGLAFGATTTVVLDDVALSPPAGESLFAPSFSRLDGLVTNEFAYWSPTNPTRRDSTDWEMTSGSLFSRSGNGYTGRIDSIQADSTSVNGTNSAIFRLTTRDHSFTDVAVRMNLDVHRFTSTSRTPRRDWDGVHLFLRYKSQYELYYASVARRDGKVLIKKKCRGGSANGGSYYPVSAEVRDQRVAPDQWTRVGASIRDNADGSVTITLDRGGRTLATATDRGIGCAPLRGAGALGIRGDNTEFEFNTFRVTSLG